MKDPSEDIAAELARWQPRATRDRLNRLVEQALEQTADPGPTRILRAWRCRWPTLAAAAAVVLIVAVTVALKDQTATRPAISSAPTLSTGARPVPNASADLAPAFRRVKQAHYLLEAADDGLIFTSRTTPWRKVRWQFLSTSEWRDEQDKTTFQLLIPREETVLIPVNLQ